MFVKEDIIKVNVSGKIFMVPRETLSKCDFFTCIFSSPDYSNQKIYIPKCQSNFKHILSYLYDEEYILPEKCFNDMKFYAFDYPKYDIDCDKIVNIECNGMIFKEACNRLCKGSDYFKNRIKEFFVGQKIRVDEDSTAFSHVMGRINTNKYFIPYEYRHLKDKYGLRALDLKSDAIVTFNINNEVRRISIKKLMMVPRFKKELKDTEFISPQKVLDIEAFDWIMSNIGSNVAVPEKYRKCSEYYEIQQMGYYDKIYAECKRCHTKIKIRVVRDNTTRSVYCIDSIYCMSHKCIKCFREISKNSCYCDHHLTTNG